MRIRLRRAALGCGVLAMLGALAGHAATPLQIKNAWVRATAPGQDVAAAYMDITATTALALTGVASPVAAKVEVHSMAIEDGIMKMRALDRLELPAGQKVDLKPGGKHLMLTGLKRPLEATTRVPIRLTFADTRGRKTTVKVDAEVRSAAPSAPH
jgi:copper(I)-binding protein